MPKDYYVDSSCVDSARVSRTQFEQLWWACILCKLYQNDNKYYAFCVRSPYLNFNACKNVGLIPKGI